MFDILAHAPWGGALDDARVLDAFAGSGALGLEALSRGATSVAFLERDRLAIAAIRANIAACDAATRSTVFATDVFRPPRCPHQAATLAFIDPPYRQDAPSRAVTALAAAGWIAAGTLLVIETGSDEIAPSAGALLALRQHGAARLAFIRMA